MGRFRTAVRLAVIAPLVAGALVAVANPAQAAEVTISGTVSCADGKAVQGIWVNSEKGGSRFADWTAFPGGPTSAYYNARLATSTPTKVQLRVGCGGNRQKWGTTDLTAERSVSRSTTWNTFCNARGACAGPAVGRKGTANSGYAGYCTFGVNQLWLEHTDFYPGWSGDAHQYGTNAAAAGYRVASQPHINSIVVFPPTASNRYGHVAWVKGIKISGGKVLLHVREMNGGRNVDRDGRTEMFGKYSERQEVPHTATMRYIVAP